MEKQVKEELIQLCQTIEKTEDDLNLSDLLTRVQMLYEKLLVLNYLQAQQPVAEATMESTEPAAETVEQQPEPQKEENQNPMVAESPLSKVEMAQDKTPEESAKSKVQPQSQSTPPQKTSVNSKLGMGNINVGLNDRISFVKHLFDDRQEDFNRVLSQLNTFESFAEAENFVEQMVKPDYDWSQKEEYEMRFMELVRHRFGEE